MKNGNLVRPRRQPLDKIIKPIDLDTLGVIREIDGVYVRVGWPDGRILTFHIGDLENLDNN